MKRQALPLEERTIPVPIKIKYVKMAEERKIKMSEFIRQLIEKIIELDKLNQKLKSDSNIITNKEGKY
ncbi:MAG: hypothetical protein KGI06_03030 [Candidatus Micrarchaeota archaeon]|nr:hypothetical protein [Candidatus Micrarchaeota archaeon]